MSPRFHVVYDIGSKFQRKIQRNTITFICVYVLFNVRVCAEGGIHVVIHLIQTKSITIYISMVFVWRCFQCNETRTLVYHFMYSLKHQQQRCVLCIFDTHGIFCAIVVVIDVVVAVLFFLFLKIYPASHLNNYTIILMSRIVSVFRLRAHTHTHKHTPQPQRYAQHPRQYSSVFNVFLICGFVWTRSKVRLCLLID